MLEFLPGASHTATVYLIATGLDPQETATLQFDAAGNMTVILYPQAHILLWRLPTTTPEHYLFTNHTDTNTYTPAVS